MKARTLIGETFGIDNENVINDYEVVVTDTDGPIGNESQVIEVKWDHNNKKFIIEI